MKHKQKGTVTLLDGRTVPDFIKDFRLPITTNRPHKWAMVDMEDGNIWLTDPENPTKTVTAQRRDVRLIEDIARQHRNS